MTKAFVEPQPKGKRAGSPITDFVVQDCADRVLARLKTREEAIHWAKTHGYTPQFPRVRHLNDKDKPHYWMEIS